LTSHLSILTTPLYISDNMVRESLSMRIIDPRFRTFANVQNPLLAAANANRNPNDEDTLSDYVPESRDISVSRAVRQASHIYLVI
jgi:hypothetical protein